MTTSGTSGKGVNSKKSWRSKAPGAPKDPTQSAKADSSLLSPAVLMALGMAGVAVAAVPESDSGASAQAENLAEHDLALDASQTLLQVAQAPVASDLQMQLADLITDLQAQAGQMPTEALPVDLNALLAAMAPQGSLGMEQIAGVSSAGAADMEPIMLAQATVAEAAVPQAASAASTAAADASAAAATAGASAAAAGAMSVSGVLMAAGAIGLVAAAGVGKSSDTSAPVDTVKPTVSTVAITSATGASNSMLNAGDVVKVTVTMSEATTVTGASTINLLVGTTTVQAAYVSGSGTAALTYSYTILAGQTDVDGISIVANTLAGTLKDAAGNTATLTHSAVNDNSSYMVDTTAPTITLLTASASAGTVTLTYNSALDASNAPAASSFTVTTGGATNAVTAVSVVGAVVTLTVTPFAAGSITVAYADPTSGDDAKAIQDLAGNDAAGFASGVVADGYVRGATVYIDTNNDGTGDVLVGTTDASGNFFIPAGTATGTIIATGGVNIDTGVANTVALKAPAGSTTINPLTTLVQAVVQASGATAAQAAATVATSLGLTLSSGVSLLSYDPIAAASSTDATAASNAVAAQKAAAQVATIVALAESASANAGASVITNLATVITTASASTTVNLADSTTITSMLGTALDSASATVKAAAQSAIADASTAISASNSLTSISSAQSQALDKTAPNAPTVTGDANTKDTTPTLRVTLNTTATDGTAVSANDVLTLKDNNVQIGSAVTLTAADIAAGYKDVTVADANALTEGAHSLSVVVTDQAGNASAASASIAVNVDLTAPSAPTISAVATDNVINSTEQTSAISGTAEAGATVSLSIGGNVRTATASAGGVWTYTLSAADVTAMGQGAETLSATATDAAGNASVVAATRSITVDTVAPTTTAAVTGANDNVDPTTGNVATGGTSNDNTLGLSGTVSAALTSGDVVAVYDASTRLGVATVSGTTWSFDTAGLTNAAHSFKAQVEDAAGNAGAQGTAYTVTVNATVPTATVSVTAAALTSDTTPTLTGVVTGTLATGDVVNVYDGTALLGSGVVSGSNWTFTPSTVLGEGAHSFTAVVQNSGGNQGTFSTAAATTIDTTAPSAPGINTVATDNIVNALEAGSSITGANEAGATVSLSIGGNSRVATVSGSAWTYTLVSADITAMAQGAETLSATQTDAAGNTSTNAGTRSITVDTVAPTVTGVLVSAGEAINASEFAAGVTITGAAEAGARVDITFADTTTVRSVTAGSTGAWTYTLVKADISAMGQGSETFTVKATDAAGNTGTPAGTTISIDTAAPTMSAFALTADSDSGTKADGKSNVAAPTIQLTAELGSTLSIDLGKGAGYQAAGTGTGASQTLTAGSAYTLDGSYTIKVKSTDAAGNTTERSGSYTYDATVATPALALASDTSTGQKVTSSGTVNVTGLESGATWEYSLNAGSTWTAGSGSSVALTGDGSKSITVRQTDTAGNISTASSALAFTLDTLVATPTLALNSDTGSSAADKISQFGVVNVSGLEAGGKWEYSLNAGTSWTTGTQSSVTLTGDGSKSITVRQTDTAGNVSTTSTALAFTVDTTIAKPTVSLTSDTGSSTTDNISSSALVTLSATAADVTRTYTVDGTTSASYTAPTTNAVHTVVVTDTDTAGNESSSQTLTFTLDKAVPTVASLSPTDGGLSLGLTANLIVTMNEAVAKGTGSLTLYKTGDVLVETIAVSSSQVTLSQDGTIVTINPTADLVKDEKYYVKAAAGTFTDIAGNAWAGISTATDWNFTGAGATVTVNAVASDNTVNLVESGSAITVSGTLGAESAVLAAYTVANMTAVLHPATGSDVTLTTLAYAPATGIWSAVIPQSSLSGTADYTLTVSFKGTTGAATGINGDGVQVVHVDTVVAAPTLALTTDSGSSTTDKITSSAALTPTGETGSSFQYSADGTTWSATAPTATAGSNTVYARQTDAAGNVSAASTALTYVYDTTGPKVSAVAMSAATGAQNSTLNAGDVLSATVTMDSATTVTGTPQLALNIGGTTVQATYASGSGTSALVFNYTVLAGQNDANGISVGVNSLALNGGSMVDVAGNAATLTHDLVDDNSSYLVDTLAPTVSIVTPSTFTSTGGTFGFTFSESVTGFAAADISVTGGSAATVAGSGASYTSVVTPTASSSTSISPLAFAVNVLAGVAADAAGNASTAATAYSASILVGTSGNDTFAVDSSVNYLFLDAGGADTLKLSAATGSTAAATDVVRGFGSGDKIDLAAILGSATGGSGYTSSTLADTGSGFLELKNLVLTQDTTAKTTLVAFDISADAATLGGSKINGAVIDLDYQYSLALDGGVSSPKYTSTKSVWSSIQYNLSLSDGTSPNGKIALVADTGSTNPIIITANTATGVVLSGELTLNGLLSTFALSFASKASGGSTEVTTADGKVYGASTDSGGLLALGISKTAGASAGTTGVLEIVSDTSTLGSGDNQLHMLTTYDATTGLTHLQVRYDTDSTYGTGHTTQSSIIAMDFVGDLTSVLTPASLTFI